MARTPRIRITENDRKEYARLVKNSKAKVRRTLKNYGINLSPEVSLPDLDTFQTRKQFNEWKEQQASFTNRNNRTYQFVKNDYGVVASKRQLFEIERATKEAQAIADKKIREIEDLPFISQGKEQGTVSQRMGLMGDAPVSGIHRPKDFEFSEIRSQSRLKQVEENMNKKKDWEYYDWRNEQLKLNFMKMLEEMFNSEADDIVDALAGIPPDDFFEMFLSYEEMQIDFYYTEEEAEGALNQVRNVLQQYGDGQLNFDLKGF